MRLYKMELFKLFQNKIFKVGMLATTGLLFLYFGLQRSVEKYRQ